MLFLHIASTVPFMWYKKFKLIKKEIKMKKLYILLILIVSTSVFAGNSRLLKKVKQAQKLLNEVKLELETGKRKECSILYCAEADNALPSDNMATCRSGRFASYHFKMIFVDASSAAEAKVQFYTKFFAEDEDSKHWLETTIEKIQCN